MKTGCLILAAGKGTRMKSSRPKVLFPICGREMINLVLDMVKAAGIKHCGVVLGFARKKIEPALDAAVTVCIQEKQGGTAHAVVSGRRFWRKLDHVVVMYGDQPLVCASTLRKLVRRHTAKKADLTLLSVHLQNPGDYGRLVRDAKGNIKAIVEKKDLTSEQHAIKDSNPGVMCFKVSVLEKVLPRIKKNTKKKEFYLTDIVDLLYRNAGKIEEIVSDLPEEEGLGVNSFQDLVRAEEVVRCRSIEKLISQGVKVFWPQSVYIETGVSIGADTQIFPFTIIERGVKIGRNCAIGPFSHIRKGTRIKSHADVGNFAELKNSHIDTFSKIKHFSYIGDARIGKDVNIGAGTVTANFDGKDKHTTVIKDGAFIGSDTVLVAPVTVGKKAKTGAGSVLAKKRDVKDNQTVAGVPARPLKK